MTRLPARPREWLLSLFIGAASVAGACFESFSEQGEL
jgi:hypothetical protein